MVDFVDPSILDQTPTPRRKRFRRAPAVATTPSPEEPTSAMGAPTHLPAGLSPETQGELDTASMILEKFPDMAVHMSDPEIFDVLMEAVEKGWSTEVMLAAMRETEYWQTTDVNRRASAIAKAQDPATWDRELEVLTKSIEDAYTQAGVAIDPERIEALAFKGKTEGWSLSEIKEKVLAQYSFDRDFDDGLIGSIDSSVDNLRRKAKLYHVPMGDESLWDASMAIEAGKDTVDGFEARMRNHAKNLYQSPELISALDAGQTVDDFLSPFRGVAARELGVPEASIDMSSDQFSGVLNHRVDGVGPVTTRSINDWQKFVRTDEKFGWKDTTRGKQAHAQGEFALRRAMGVR